MTDVRGALSEEGLEPMLSAIRNAGLPDITAWSAQRWVTVGIGKKPNVKLEAIRCGRRWYSTVPAVRRFIAAQNQHRQKPRSLTQAEATESRRLAAAQLAAKGLGPDAEGGERP